jgi:hypothetical protein
MLRTPRVALPARERKETEGASANGLLVMPEGSSGRICPFAVQCGAGCVLLGRRAYGASGVVSTSSWILV